LAVAGALAEARKAIEAEIAAVAERARAMADADPAQFSEHVHG